MEQIDCLVRHEDGTFGVIDFKTSSPSSNSKLYARQLHAYAMAVENPSAGSELIQGKVTDLGLVVYSPNAFHTPRQDDGNIAAALLGELNYIQIKKDEDAFVDFLGEIVDVLSLPQAPPPPPPNSKTAWSGNKTSCPYCQFLLDANAGHYVPSPPS